MPLSLDALAALNEAFAESDLPWKVDVVDWARMGDAFRCIVERDRVVLQRVDDAGNDQHLITTGFVNAACTVTGNTTPLPAASFSARRFALGSPAPALLPLEPAATATRPSRSTATHSGEVPASAIG